MKLLSLIYGLSQIANPVLVNKHQSVSLNTNTEVFAKDINMGDVTKNNGYYILQNKTTKNYLLNEEQSQLLTDVRTKDIDLAINYEATFITDFVRNSVQFSHHYNDLLGIKDNNKVSKLKDLKNNDIEIKTGSVSNKIEHKSKDGNTAISLNPYISFKGENFEKDSNNLKGFYELKIKNITVEGSKEVYDLSNIKMNPINVSYGITSTGDAVDDWLETNELERHLNSEYGLPLGFADKEATKKNFKHDTLNHVKNNKLYLNVIPNNLYAVEGQLEQEINFSKDEGLFDDLIDLDEIYSSTLKSTLDKYYVDSAQTITTIDIDNEEMWIKHLNRKCDWVFVTDGPLEKGLTLKIIKDGKVAATLSGDTVIIEDEFKGYDFNGLIDNYSEPKPEEPSKPIEEDKEPEQPNKPVDEDKDSDKGSEQPIDETKDEDDSKEETKEPDQPTDKDNSKDNETVPDKEPDQPIEEPKDDSNESSKDDEQAKPDEDKEEIKDETNKDEDNKETIDKENESKEDLQQINVEQDELKQDKKSNPYKYLWLLAIPIVLGIATFLTYFIRFKKRKSK